ncbi:MAG: DUF3380 domain-containing protein [Caldilineaceae bacterium]|nr:DUF3380 domain-containing protein [Caldilineaceae bacterium]
MTPSRQTPDGAGKSNSNRRGKRAEGPPKPAAPQAQAVPEPAWAALLPQYIYGLHEAGGEHLMVEAGRPGWVLELASVGLDGGGDSPADYSALSSQGFGVIVRLNNGFEPVGTIPAPDRYPAFAESCARFVGRARGCRIWIIGNEPNHKAERPDGRFILPAEYARCYRLCRTAIRSQAGHEGDLVLVAGPAPWNAETRYPGNPSGDWARYFADILAELPAGDCDGFAIHTYTRTLDPERIRVDIPFNADGYRHLHDEFRSYRDFMLAIPDRFRQLPVLITETDPTTPQVGWADGKNTGWVRAAYEEIADWNADPAHQPIQALLLYRWPPGSVHGQHEWSISDRPGIVEDFRQALQLEPSARFRVRLPALEAAAGEEETTTATTALALVPHIYTNQQLINAFHDAAVAAGLEPWALLEKAGLDLAALSAIRELPYSGTSLALLPALSAAERRQIRRQLLAALSEGPRWRGFVNAPDGLNLRTGPGVQFDVISTLAHDDDVNVLAEEGDWLFVTAGDLDGYIFAAHVLRREVAPAPGTEQDLAAAEGERLAILSTASHDERTLVETWNQYGGLLGRLSAQLNIEPGVALAVLLAESAGEPFGPDGRLVIRFEVHIFHRQWGSAHSDQFNAHFRFDTDSPWQGHAWRTDPNGPWQALHQSQADEWRVLEFARGLDDTAALLSISMGAPQIMGFNFDTLGYKDVQSMFQAFQAGVATQIAGLFRFIQQRGLAAAIRREDFLDFATNYNGSGAAKRYAALISQWLEQFRRLRAAAQATIAATMQPAQQEVEMTRLVPERTAADKAALPAPPVPTDHEGRPLAEVDPELYEAWRHHIEQGFTNNNRMFNRVLNAFMYPYWMTVAMYLTLFLIGIGAFVVAARLSFEQGKELYAVLFGGLGVVSMLTFFVTRPLQALEENLQFITWLGMIYNTYWTRLAYTLERESAQVDIENATVDAIRKIKELLDKHTERSSNRPGLR